MSKTLHARVIQIHDIEANWQKATSFIPRPGEVVVYDIDETHMIERFKIGDGITPVNNLPFTIDYELKQFFKIKDDNTIYVDGGRITNTMNSSC